MIKINTTQKDFFEKGKFVLISKVYDGDIVEIEFTDSTVEFVVIKTTEIYFSKDSERAIDLLNFLGNGLKRTLIHGGTVCFDLNRYEVLNDEITINVCSLNSQYFTRFDEIKIIKEIEVKNFKRLGNKK